MHNSFATMHVNTLTLFKRVYYAAGVEVSLKKILT